MCFKSCLFILIWLVRRQWAQLQQRVSEKHVSHQHQLKCKQFRAICMYWHTFLISTSTHHEGENALTLICAHTRCSLCLTLHCMCSWDRLRLSDESPLYHPRCASIYSPVIPEGGEKSRTKERSTLLLPSACQMFVIYVNSVNTWWENT